MTEFQSVYAYTIDRSFEVNAVSKLGALQLGQHVVVEPQRHILVLLGVALRDGRSQSQVTNWLVATFFVQVLARW